MDGILGRYVLQIVTSMPRDNVQVSAKTAFPKVYCNQIQSKSALWVIIACSPYY